MRNRLIDLEDDITIGEYRDLQLENEELKEQIEYLSRSIERKEEIITDLENERVPYTNEYVKKIEQERDTYKQALEDINDIVNKRLESVKK